ncbi:MAG TPA: outer membrane beta-barrel protein [Candidatus Acidoferrales bacterium]|nr:outer membrane beta-barrel protein [Candidatus Acidoferrales bacterium]
MRRILCIAAMLLFAAPFAFAQEPRPDHVEVGVFAHYFRLNPPDTNSLGAGVRLGVNFTRNVQLEAEASYDFNQVFTERYTDTSGTVTSTRSNLRVLHALIGPKFQSSGPVKLFATVKGGIINFRFDPTPGIFSGLKSSIQNLRDDNVRGVLYPGGGFEAFLGPIGLRLDVGDEIYFLSGAHNNLAVTFGPSIRF